MDDSKASPMGCGVPWIEKQEHGQSCLDIHPDMDDMLTVIMIVPL
jgi:hypothetical protein